MSIRIEIEGKGYRVSTLDIGQGPSDYVSVRVPTGPNCTAVSYVWRAVPRHGPTWNKVMRAVRRLNE